MLKESGYEDDNSPFPSGYTECYSDVTLLSETDIYYVFGAKSMFGSRSIYTIRAFNSNSKFSKENFDFAFSLFIKEMLHLMAIDQKSVIINSFKVSHEGKKMAFAALPYIPLSYELEEERKLAKEKKENFKGISALNNFEGVKDMIADLTLDLEFLTKGFKIQDCSKILVPESIYRFKESGACFLGDWVKTLLVYDDRQLESTISVSESEIYSRNIRRNA